MHGCYKRKSFGRGPLLQDLNMYIVYKLNNDLLNGGPFHVEIKLFSALKSQGTLCHILLELYLRTILLYSRLQETGMHLSMVYDGCIITVPKINHEDHD